MATGDKKRAVMTTDINNSGSDYPVMPLKTIDTSTLSNDSTHIPASSVVKSALDALPLQHAKDAVFHKTGSSFNMTIPGDTRHLILIGAANITRCAALLVTANAAGTSIGVQELGETSTGHSFTINGNVITYTSDASTTFVIYDLSFYKSNITVS